jgi:hypothetical protein
MMLSRVRTLLFGVTVVSLLGSCHNTGEISNAFSMENGIADSEQNASNMLDQAYDTDDADNVTASSGDMYNLAEPINVSALSNDGEQQ